MTQFLAKINYTNSNYIILKDFEEKNNLEEHWICLRNLKSRNKLKVSFDSKF